MTRVHTVSAYHLPLLTVNVSAHSVVLIITLMMSSGLQSLIEQKLHNCAVFFKFTIVVDLQLNVPKMGIGEMGPVCTFEWR